MRTLHHHTLALAAFAGSLLFASCSNTPAEQKAETDKKIDNIQDDMADSKMADTQKEWEKERADVLADLRDLRDNIDKELSSTNVALADKDLKPSVRKEKEAMKAELEREKANVEAMIAKAEGATDATWVATKAELQKASDDVKGWWARLKENVDKKTDADKDKDGH